MLSAIRENIRLIRNTIQTLSESMQIQYTVRLVAVSKTKPVTDLLEAYNEGQRHFGENYVDELLGKEKQMPDDVMWHFIGHLQSNKAKLLAAIPNLYCVETIDSQKLAQKLNSSRQTTGLPPLKVFVQVNTSSEGTKSGVEPESCISLARFIIERCPNLAFSGLMTIGMPGETNDFRILSSLRDSLCAELSLDKSSVELSMGMSSDYEQAIREGSTNVRVGSTIFGERIYSK